MAASSDDGFATRVPPTVSKDKTLQLTLHKLERGWVIVMGPKGKNANLFKPGKGFTPILFSVAVRLLELGLIQEDGPHFMGTRYILAEDADPTIAVKPVVEVDDDDDELEDDGDDSGYEDIETLNDVDDDYESDGDVSKSEEGDQDR